MSILYVMNLIVYLSHRGITLHATRTCFALVSWEMLWYLNNTCHRLISCREQLPNSLSIKSCQSKKCFAIKLFLFWIGWCLWEMQSYVIAVRVTWEEFCLISLQCDWEPTDSWTPRIMGSKKGWITQKGCLSYLIYTVTALLLIIPFNNNYIIILRFY